MQTHHSECTVLTTSPPEFIDITQEVDRALETSHVSEGLVTVSVPTGCAIVVNEYESGLISDLKRVLAELKHSANGSEPSIGSSSVVLPAAEGKLRLGRWQRLLLVELEKSTDREVNIQVVGD
ncbi:MAG TPA: YjbQ family protein [Actinomycetota bacterium]|nr:YjbQ family protein [Actinomycetota bacterium]